MRALTGLSIVALLLTGACASWQATRTPTPIPPPSPTLTQAPTTVPTPTFAPVTNTPQPIFTSAPPVMSIQVIVGSLNVSSAQGIPLYRAPSADAEVVLVLPGGTIARAQQRSPDYQWYRNRHRTGDHRLGCRP